MPRPNDEIAALLGEYAELISITGGDAFRARSYERAARAIKGYPPDVSDLSVAELRQIPGVGKSVADKVAEYLKTGSIAAVEAIRAEIPVGVREMIAIPALGPNRAFQLHAELGIGSVAVCLLFSFTNPAHERRVRDILAGEAPALRVSLSSDVLPRIREWPRISTMLLNA
ncbi:MAG: helix-hairpin-helix domain-containing protein, partial [Streptosporangiaceae bacterium]